MGFLLVDFFGCDGKFEEYLVLWFFDDGIYLGLDGWYNFDLVLY